MIYNKILMLSASSNKHGLLLSIIQSSLVKFNEGKQTHPCRLMVEVLDFFGPIAIETQPTWSFYVKFKMIQKQAGQDMFVGFMFGPNQQSFFQYGLLFFGQSFAVWSHWTEESKMRNSRSHMNGRESWNQEVN